MARIKNDNVYLEPFQKLSFRDDDGSEAASIYWDGDQMVFNGITISGAEGPPGPAGTGVPGNYIGDEDNNSRVTVNTTDDIIFKTAGTDRGIVTAGGNFLIGHNDPTTVGGKVNIVHTGSNNLVLDNHATSSAGPGVWFKKSRGGRDEVSIAAVAAQDVLGELDFFGWTTSADTDGYFQGAKILSRVDGTPAEDSLPSNLEFWTTAGDWLTDKVKGLEVTTTGEILLQSGVPVDNISSILTSGLTNSLVTGEAVYDAIQESYSYTDDLFTTLSGLDLSMSTLFDPTYSGTEVKIFDDEIVFKSQGETIGKFNSVGYFFLENGVGVNNIFNGNLNDEATEYSIPTSATVKSYVDEYSGAGGSGWSDMLRSDGGLSDLQLSENSWTATLGGEPILQMASVTHTTGINAGKKTSHVFFGDQIDNLPTWTSNFGSDASRPTFLFHSLLGSRLYIYNKKGYGDETLPYSVVPGIVINREGTSVGDNVANIHFVGGNISMFNGNTETYPDLPDSENQMEIHLGSYARYFGEIGEAGGPGSGWPGGILKLFCKLRFGGGYSWGMENESNWIYPTTENPNDDGWGHYGNNVWVNRIAGCHYTQPEANVGAKFNNPPEFFIGTGNDDHCLVTGKYVHTAIDQAIATAELSLSGNKIESGTEGYDEINHTVSVGPTGVVLTYGWKETYDTYLSLFTPSYANHNNGDKLRVGAFFRSTEAAAHNRVLIESQCQGASDIVLDAINGYNTTAAKLVFFRSRKGWLGNVAAYGAEPVVVGDVLGTIDFIAQAEETGYNRNPCQHYSAYHNSASIRVYAADNPGSYRTPADMCFHLDNGHEGGYYVDNIKTFTLRGVSQTAHFGDWRSVRPLSRRDSELGMNSYPGKVHVHDITFNKTQMSGNITLNGGNSSSIMFGSEFVTPSVAGLDMSKKTAVYTEPGNTYGCALARIDGSRDSTDGTNNSGRLSFMIHKHDDAKFTEVMRLASDGITIGDDDGGRGMDQTPSSKLCIQQHLNTYFGGISLVNTDGKGSYVFTNADDELVLNSANDGTRTVKINSGNGVVHIGGASDTGAEYILRTNGTIIPAVNNVYDLGSSSYKWDDIWATNNVIQTSDARQKTEIKTADLGLDFVKEMKPRKFKRLGGKRTHWGFVAQELEALVGKFGRKTKDTAFIVKDDQGNYGLRDTELLAIVVKAIQELAAKVEA